MSELPPGWVSATLGDVISGFETGRNFRASGIPAQVGEYGVLKISAVTWGRFQPDENKALLHGDAPLPHELIRAGDLLISRANTTELVGAPVLVDQDYPHLMLPDKILRLLYDERAVDRRFLLHALRTQSARAYIEKNATGTSESMRNLSQPKLREIPLALAPRSEQTRIAEKLDALLTRVSACRERLDRVSSLLSRFRQSVLAAATSGELTREWREANPSIVDARLLASKIEAAHVAAGGHKAGNAAPPTDGVHDLTTEMFPSGWRLATLRDLVRPDRSITYGILKPGPELEHGVPYVRVADFPDDRLKVDSIRKTSPSIDEEFKRSRLRQGDLLLSIRGTVQLVDWLWCRLHSKTRTSPRIQRGSQYNPQSIHCMYSGFFALTSFSSE